MKFEQAQISLPCEQSQFSSPTRKIDSAVYPSKCLDEATGLNQFLMCAALFILLTDD